MADSKKSSNSSMVEQDTSPKPQADAPEGSEPRGSKPKTAEEIYRETRLQRLKQTEDRFIKWFKFIVIFGIVFCTFWFRRQIGKWARSYVKDLKKAKPSTNEDGILIGPDGIRLVSKDELAIYNSRNKDERWIGLRGEVLNTTGLGDQFYTEGQGYEFFAGIDATRAFMTGEFNERGLRDDVWDFDQSQCGEIQTWTEELMEKYQHVGHVAGGYWYDLDGRKTEGHRQFLQSVKNEKRKKAIEAEELKKEHQKFAPCNVKADPKGIMTYSCTKKSGGVQRDWVGKPRKFRRPGKTVVRCACVIESELGSPQVSHYDDCDPEATQCVVDKYKRKQAQQMPKTEL